MPTLFGNEPIKSGIKRCRYDRRLEPPTAPCYPPTMSDPTPNEGTVRCPHCGQTFTLSDALTGPLRDHLRSELQEESTARLEAETRRIRAEAEKTIRGKLETELKDREDALAQSQKALAEAREKELALRKQARTLQDKQAALELEITRKLDEEREKLVADSRKQFEEERHLKDKEKNKLIDDLRKALEEARRKAEQGSMETQGEVLELDLESTLGIAFPTDGFLPVPKGVRGADLVQHVRDGQARDCGTILWETKNTKRWGNQWIAKLKDDQVAAGASVAILVSSVLPDDVAHFGYVDGVWVCDPPSATGLAIAMRHQLIALTFEKLTSVGKNEKMETLYRYLTGPEFRQKIETIVQSFTGMQEQVHRERRAMEKLWKEREKQIQRVVLNTSSMYGDISGIAGALPDIEILALDQPADPAAEH